MEESACNVIYLKLHSSKLRKVSTGPQGFSHAFGGSLGIREVSTFSESRESPPLLGIPLGFIQSQPRP